ncbi:MAG: glycoside hydrolase family 71/99-like protein, partial [Bacteroidales bacterium]
MKKRINIALVTLFLLPVFLAGSLRAQVVLQRCDVSNLWEGSNNITVNTFDKKEGAASIDFSGSGIDWFKKKFSRTNTGIDETGWFNFWLYVSDVSKFDGDGQVELTSSGVPDLDEYSWSISSLGLTNGWNYVQLALSEANKTGLPDLEAINFFRIFQGLSGQIIARLDDLRFSSIQDPMPVSNDPLDIQDPEFTTLDGKVMFGYQGWFSHPDDGSELAQWRHWGTMQDANTLQVEMYPDMEEHEADEKYMTGLTFADGRPARIYSAYNRKTVMRHMKWLRDYDLDGVFLQRFNTSLRSTNLKAVRDTVTVNVMMGCERYGRAFVNMYDLSGLGTGNIDQLIEDWKHLVDDLKITESPNYLWHRGKPLVSLWGFTVRDDLPVEDLEQAIDFFQNSPEERYRATIMLGTNHDFFNRGAWASSLSKVDVISPWTVGRYNNASSNSNFVESYLKPGQDWCDQRNIDFLPVVWPGFSWYNLKGEGTWQKNQIPRQGGEFIWTQATRAVSANAKSVYIAMFDEVDEATAMYKVTETLDDVPDQGYWLTLDADGHNLPSDWYLRIAKKLTRVVKGTIENTPTLGTPSDGIDNFSVVVQSTKCGTTQGKLTFSYPEVHADSILQFSIDGGNTYPYTTPAGSTTLESGSLASGAYDVWVRRMDGSFPTDLGTHTIFDFYPDA